MKNTKKLHLLLLALLISTTTQFYAQEEMPGSGKIQREFLEEEELSAASSSSGNTNGLFDISGTRATELYGAIVAMPVAALMGKVAYTAQQAAIIAAEAASAQIAAAAIKAAEAEAELAAQAAVTAKEPAVFEDAKEQISEIIGDIRPWISKFAPEGLGFNTETLKNEAAAVKELLPALQKTLQESENVKKLQESLNNILGQLENSTNFSPRVKELTDYISKQLKPLVAQVTPILPAQVRLWSPIHKGLVASLGTLGAAYVIVKLITYAQEKYNSNNPADLAKATLLTAQMQELLEDSKEL